MWKQCYCRCSKVAKAVAPFLTETQWFCTQWHLFLTMTRTSLAWSLHQNDDRIWIHVIANFLKQIGMTHLYISKAEQSFLPPLHQWNADALLRLTYDVAINLKCYTHIEKKTFLHFKPLKSHRWLVWSFYILINTTIYTRTHHKSHWWTKRPQYLSSVYWHNLIY